MKNISIHIIDTASNAHKIKVPVDTSRSLMDVIKSEGFSMGNCGGMALCASCHCFVKHDEFLINAKTEEEEDMLDQLHNSDINRSRLICQIPLSEKLDGIKVEIVKD